MAVQDSKTSVNKEIESLLTKEERKGEMFYTVNEEACKEKAKEFVVKLSKEGKVPNDPKNLGEVDEFKKDMEAFKTSEYYCKADKLVAEKIIEKKKVDESKNDVEPPKNPWFDFKIGLDMIAGGGLIGILVLIVVSVGCVVECQDASYAATSIVNSNFMVVLTSTVVAPMVTRVMKEKFDIDIDTSQVSMILKDGVATATKYQKLADQLRDDDGKIPPEHISKLKGLAMVSMKETFEIKKYKGLIASTGGQILDKAIEKAVNDNKLDKKLIEKNQIEELIKQGIDAHTTIVEWKNLDAEVKDAFVQGHIRRLLKNTGIEGIGRTKLENMFDAEVTKRLLQAARLDIEGVTPKLGENGKYLKYSSTALEVLLKKLN